MDGECSCPTNPEKRCRATAKPGAGGPALQCFQVPSLFTARTVPPVRSATGSEVTAWLEAASIADGRVFRRAQGRGRASRCSPTPGHCPGREALRREGGLRPRRLLGPQPPIRLSHQRRRTRGPGVQAHRGQPPQARGASGRPPARPQSPGCRRAPIRWAAQRAYRLASKRSLAFRKVARAASISKGRSSRVSESHSLRPGAKKSPP